MGETDTVPVMAALGNWGVCPTIEWRGKKYTLGHPDQVKKAIYENAIADAELALLNTQLSRKWITPEKYDAKLDDLTARIDGPRFEHQAGGPLWMDYTFGKKAQTGTVLFLWSLFVQHHPEMSVVDAQTMLSEVPTLVNFHLRKVVPSFFEWAAAQLKAPPEAMIEVRKAIAAVTADLESKLPTPETPTDTAASMSTPT